MVAMRHRALQAGAWCSSGAPEPLHMAHVIVFWLVGGWMGAHHFLLGNCWRGVGYMLSVGGCGVGFLADGLCLGALHGAYQARRRVALREHGVLGSREYSRGEALRAQREAGGAAPGPTAELEAALAGEELAEEHEVKVRDERTDLVTAYILLLSFGGLLGVHHLYLRRWGHFCLAFVSLNLLGVGLVLDAMSLPGWVRERNEEEEEAAFQAAREAGQLGDPEVGSSSGGPGTPGTGGAGHGGASAGVPSKRGPAGGTGGAAGRKPEGKEGPIGGAGGGGVKPTGQSGFGAPVGSAVAI